MRTNASTQISWKQFFQDAVFELDPHRFEKKLEAARMAIANRLLEINSNGPPNPLELAELTDAQRTVAILQRENTA